MAQDDRFDLARLERLERRLPPSLRWRAAQVTDLFPVGQEWLVERIMNN
jgi:hypothetical protein